MKQIIVTGILCLFLSSCVSTYMMGKENISYTELNKRLTGEEIQINLITGEKIKSNDVIFDSTTTISHGIEYATDSIQSVSYLKRGKGALKGLGYGAAIGFVWALLIPAPEPGPGSGSQGLVYIVLPAAGMLLGSAIGNAVGNKEIYVLPGNKP